MNDKRPTASDNGHEEESPGQIAQEGDRPNGHQTDERGAAMKESCEHELRAIRDCLIEEMEWSKVP